MIAISFERPFPESELLGAGGALDRRGSCHCEEKLDSPFVSFSDVSSVTSGGLVAPDSSTRNVSLFSSALPRSRSIVASLSSEEAKGAMIRVSLSLVCVLFLTLFAVRFRGRQTPRRLLYASQALQSLRPLELRHHIGVVWAAQFEQIVGRGVRYVGSLAFGAARIEDGGSPSATEEINCLPLAVADKHEALDPMCKLGPLLSTSSMASTSIFCVCVTGIGRSRGSRGNGLA